MNYYQLVINIIGLVSPYLILFLTRNNLKYDLLCEIKEKIARLEEKVTYLSDKL